MNVVFRTSFARDLKKIKDSRTIDAIRKSIAAVGSADGIREIPNCKKLAGTHDCYRIRIGEYRIGIVVAKDTAEFVRCLNRREMYRYFP